MPLFINRSLVFILLTFACLSIFILIIFVLQRIVSSPLALAGAVLILVVLFQPLRHAIQWFIDRTIFNIHIDYETAAGNYPLALSELPPDTQLVVAQPHERFGEFEAVRLLVQGRISQIYQGEHYQTARMAAIKVLNVELINEQPMRDRFRREAEIMQPHEHKHIIKMFGHGEKDGLPYLVMDYLHGPTLQDYLFKEKGKLRLDVTRSILKDIATALDYLHQHGIVHGDIQPSNILLRPTTIPQTRTGFRYEAVLTDFGSAYLVGSPPKHSMNRQIGRLDYMSPEQITKAHEIDHRADIYALGILAFYLLTGTLPYGQNTELSIALAHLYSSIPDVRDIQPTLPTSVAMSIRQAMAKNPDERFNRASEFVWALLL